VQDKPVQTYTFAGGEGVLGGGKRAYVRIRLDQIRNEKGTDRRNETEGVGELARSIAACGLLHPLVVRKTGKGYAIVCGRRRLQALRLLGEKQAEALILETDAGQSAICALVENVQRVDLSCFEEAEAYRDILKLTGMRQDALARQVGKSPSAVANKLRLLKLTPAARKSIMENELSERHARALLKLPAPQMQEHAAELAGRGRMSVRQTEELVEKLLRQPEKKPALRLICRDSRLFLNALMRTVKQIQGAGFGVQSRVEETPEGVRVTVLLPRVAAAEN